MAVGGLAAVTVLLLLFQQGFCVFNLSAKFFGAGTEQHSPQAIAERRNDSVSETRLS
ncbi:hypothetical protein ACZ87_01993 [Candidatus Erwinia dacicola]|uniref:Uncharacterized protein n=1 Tax=Candidatus Erwinia dacicola TaxID=252393 RepID=A0A328TKQ8_9GAMM|nr:hypothetical protein ACZ87_01993 [Candidatus Erwinia dacicola]